MHRASTSTPFRLSQLSVEPLYRKRVIQGLNISLLLVNRHWFGADEIVQKSLRRRSISALEEWIQSWHATRGHRPQASVPLLRGNFFG